MNVINQTVSQHRTELSAAPKQELFFSRFAIANMMDAMFFVNSVAQIIWVNHAVCSLTEYSREELLSMTIYDLNLNLVRSQWSKYQEDIKREEAIVVESFHCNKTGQRFPVELKITNIEYEDQKYNCILLRDISQQKQAIAVWQKSNLNLERKIKQRTAELASANEQLHNQLAQVQRKLSREKKLDHQRAQFIALVSHELRAPLNIISFANSMLQRYGEVLSQSKKHVHLNQIKDGVQQLDRLIDTIILIGKAKANKLKFHPQKINLQQFCHDLIAQLQLGQENQPKISFISHGNHRKIAVDAQLLQSILRNLLDNAIKYSASDSTIDLVMKYKDRELMFQVKDRGIGIPEADLSQLFEPFVRGQNIGDIKGHGLGLTIVKQLVEIHQGQIDVVSKVSLGTTVTILLPLASA